MSRQQAEAWLELATKNPGRVIDELDQIETFAQSAEPDAAAIALRAAGLAAANQQDVNSSLALLDRAQKVAMKASPEVAGEVNMTYGAVLSWAGQAQEADLALSQAIDRLEGPRLGRALVQRGTVRGRLSLFEEALADFRAAETLLDPEDRVWWGRLWSSRGTVIAFTGERRRADRELRRAQAWFRDMDDEGDAALIDHTRGWLAGLAGDIPQALELLDVAEEKLERMGRPLAELWRDRCDILLAAQLIPEALAAARSAVFQLARKGFVAAADEARLRVARAAFLGGDLATAESQAREAWVGFEAAGRPGWALMAAAVEIQARLARTGGDTALIEQAKRLASQASDAGLGELAVAARLSAVEAALGTGEIAVAESLLASSQYRDLRFDLELARLLALARVQSTRGEVKSALRAARQGMKLVGAQQAMLGDAEIRAGVASHGDQLGRLGLSLASSGTTRSLFDWFERTRAGSLRYPVVRPPEDEALATDLARLRSIDAVSRGLLVEGTPPDVKRRRAKMEKAVRQRWRRGTGTGHGQRPVTASQVLATLNEDTCLIEFGSIDGEATAIVLYQGRARRRQLGDVHSLELLSSQLRFDLSRLAGSGQSQPGLEAASTSVNAVLSEIDGTLIQRLSVALPQEVVIVPSTELQEIPWSLLPGLRDRAVAVAPSATIWWQRQQMTNRGEGALLVAGPDLEEAWTEVETLGQVWTSPTTIPPSLATADEVLKGLAGRAIAHLACHGSFRADSPMFSSLVMADGPLYVYDLYRLSPAPQIMVLSACDVGQAAVRPGSEVLGVVAALLGNGCNSVVASVGLVPDLAATRSFMGLLHEQLAAGVPAPLAAAQARRQTDWSDPRHFPAAAFTCFGA